MNKNKILILLFLVPISLFAQIISKPRGCFAGTNGTNPAVISHEDARGVLLTEKWADIEPSPGVYNFSTLNNKINTIKVAGLKYSLAISCGAFGSPDWLIDSLKVSYHSFQYQNQFWRLPLWWDTTCIQKLTELINHVGNQFALDSMLSHVYVSQMTVNGIEGHLNGVNMSAFAADGFTNQKWITSAITTTNIFAKAFSDKPLVFEVHEIDQDTVVPAAIIDDFKNDPDYCDRIGVGMWWISGKTTYQAKLIDFIYNFKGDKYAQVIGRSDQPERFKDGLYSSVFTQAKYLNIRYIEPWPYEFQFHTQDSLIHDFNQWADNNFSATDTCIFNTSVRDLIVPNHLVRIYPNPTKGLINFKIDFTYQSIEIKLLNYDGICLLTTINQTELDISSFPEGIYFIKINLDNNIIVKKILMIE